MTTSQKQSDLLKSVLNLDASFAELSRLGATIEKLELRTDSDFERAQKLLGHFSECAQKVSNGVVAMSESLGTARAQAEMAAQIVAARAGEMQILQEERQKKTDAFRQLTEKVQAINHSLITMKKPAGEFTDEDRARITMRFTELAMQLPPLIAEAEMIKTAAHSSKMGVLEQNAHSLQQSLLSLRQKLGGFSRDTGPLQ
jgi:hypothetical protein